MLQNGSAVSGAYLLQAVSAVANCFMYPLGHAEKIRNTEKVRPLPCGKTCRLDHLTRIGARYFSANEYHVLSYTPFATPSDFHFEFSVRLQFANGSHYPHCRWRPRLLKTAVIPKLARISTTRDFSTAYPCSIAPQLSSNSYHQSRSALLHLPSLPAA